MDKLKMHSPNLVDANIEKISALFPNCITETKDENGELKKAIDFDLLKQELSQVLVEGEQERYRLDWVGKKEAILTANAPIAKTLRPYRDESVDFDKTQNLFIEGDNLEALKLLQENYLGKVKMIYIDPPYNTGKDFVYEDDFAESTNSFFEKSSQVDEEGNRLVANTESNGRFHSDWLSMMYSRLKLARNLLKDDGVVFISIDDNEQDNLNKICNEILGEQNFIAMLPTIMNLKGNNDQFGFAGTHEYLLVYAKNLDELSDLNGLPLDIDDIKNYNLKDSKGLYKLGATLMRTGEAGARNFRPKGYYPIYVSQDLTRMSLERLSEDDFEVFPKTTSGQEMSWRRSPETLSNSIDEFIIKKTSNGISFYKKQRLDEDNRIGKKPKSLFYKPEYSSSNGTGLLKNIFGDRFFDNPKPLALLMDLIRIGSTESSIILDFFAGSATTAHAVMQLNAEDAGKRKFIMVQLPEVTDEKSEAYKAGYKTIADISKERIRRAGKKILEDNATKEGIENLDIGFRVLKIDSTNMKDVYYTPDALKQADMLDLADHIKSDRTSEDLLFQVMLDWGLELSLPIERKTIVGKEVFYVAGNSLVACFDDLTFDVVDEVAKDHPLRFVSAEKAIHLDHDKTNIKERFKQLSRDTEVKFL